MGGGAWQKESPLKVVEPTTEKERHCIVAERANGTAKSPTHRGQRST